MIELVQTIAAIPVVAAALILLLARGMEDADTRRRERRAAIRNRQEPR